MAKDLCGRAMRVKDIETDSRDVAGRLVWSSIQIRWAISLVPALSHFEKMQTA